MLESLERHCKASLSWNVPDGGMFFWARDAAALLEATLAPATGARVAFVPVLRSSRASRMLAHCACHSLRCPRRGLRKASRSSRERCAISPDAAPYALDVCVKKAVIRCFRSDDRPNYERYLITLDIGAPWIADSRY
jgi:hypothetical protein